MPEVSATIDKELYEQCREHARHRWGASARMSDYVRAALVQLVRRDLASASKKPKAGKVPDSDSDAMPVQSVQRGASGGVV